MYISFLIFVLAILPQWAQAIANESTPCVEHFDPHVDYFPHKTRLSYARGFAIDYFNHYKIITVSNPWPGAQQTFRYLLIQCGTPIPEGMEGARVIRIPVDTVAAMSTAHVAHLELLGEVESLIAISSLDRIYSPRVHRWSDAGKIAEIGWASHINVELLVDKAPDLVTAVGYNRPQLNIHPLLEKAGIPVVLNGEYMEPSLLGQAEWLKFTAAFFNKEALAERHFDDIINRYHRHAALTQAVPVDQQPTVFSGTLHGDTWYVSGGESTIAQLLDAAGGRYLWAENDNRGGLPVSLEVVFERALTADYWLTSHSSWQQREDMLAADPRYGAFKAFRAGNIYNNNARVNETGANDYWETGIVEPHVILADIIKILHPELMPEHTLKYFQPLR